MKSVRHIAFIAALLLVFTTIDGKAAGKGKDIKIDSPDKHTTVAIDGKKLTFAITHDGMTLVTNASIGLTTSDRTDINHVTMPGVKHRVSEHIDAPFYRQSHFTATCNEMELKLNDGFSVVFRVYDDGVAYRFKYNENYQNMRIVNELANYRFPDDCKAWMPYTTNEKKPYAMAFQNYYEEKLLSEQLDMPAFLPVTVDTKGAKVTILESDLEGYPGMFLQRDGIVKIIGKKSANSTDGHEVMTADASVDFSLRAQFPKYPKSFENTPHRQQKQVTETENYIARLNGKRAMPWRIFAISDDDTEMPVNNLVYALASPNRIGDTSWIKPGKVAWDWWNAWNLKGVDFEAGINMETYKYYIDFAAKNGIEYVVLDEGWYDPASGDMLTVIPALNLKELIGYANSKHVDIVLWTVFNVLDSQLEEACTKYAAMGVKGFKVDFLDRNDQEGVEMAYRIAETCARHHLFLDYHGFYAPTGLNRTYPNVLNFEGVFGMEEVKWKPEDKDMPKYDVTFPFIRMMSGNVDFTPGAMRNATKADWRPVYYSPMSQGTRCHQMAMYIVFDSPFTMLCDAPTNYEREPEFVQFVASLPNTYEETRILSGKIGEYIVTARRNGKDWYIGGMTDWTQRNNMTIDLSFLPAGTYEADLFCDGKNAAHNAEDWHRKQFTVQGGNDSPAITLAPGGGFAMKLIAR